VGVLMRFVAAIAATTTVFCADAARAGDAGPNNPSFLLFAGTDLWRDGAFLNGGLLWSPAGLDTSGFTLKLLLAGGRYIYPSGTLGMDVAGTALSASVLPGWRMTHDGLTIDVYAGPVAQDYRLSPYDPGSLLRGAYAGGQFATDLWYQPTASTLIALDGSIASIGLIGSARAAFGWRSSEPFFIGPEAQTIWCVDYQQWRFGAHVTGWRIDALELSGAAGWAVESFGRTGPYVRIGLNTRL
jgi:hypothetical protein